MRIQRGGQFYLLKSKHIAVLPAVILIAISIYFILSTSMNVRYWADDFCMAATYDNHGFWGSLRFWWHGWTGRFSYIFFFNLANAFGEGIINILPIATFVAMFASAYLIVEGYLKDKLISIVLAFLFIVILLINAPNIIQSFYWQSGVLVYIIPVAFLQLFFALFFYQRYKFSIYIPFLITFVSGGFSEVFSIVQLCLLFLTLVLLLLHSKKEYLKFAIAGLVGTIVALIIMFISPGNEARAASVTQPESISFVITSTILTTKWYLLRMLGIPSFIYCVFIIISGVMVFTKPLKLDRKKAYISICLSIVTIVLLTLGVMASGYYAMAYIPPERALFVVFYGALVCILILGIFLRSLIGDKFKLVFYIVFFLSTVALAVNTYHHWSSISAEVNNYAQKWDVEKQKILSNIVAGQMSFDINYINPVGSLDGFIENKGWVTSCVKGYYRVKDIKVNQ